MIIILNNQKKAVYLPARQQDYSLFFTPLLGDEVGRHHIKSGNYRIAREKAFIASLTASLRALY